MAWQWHLKSWFVVQNLKNVEIRVFIFSKLFVWHFLRESVRNREKKMKWVTYIETQFINFCATVIVGTWVVLLKGCNRGLSSPYLKLFFRDILLKTEAHSPALASQSEALNLKLLSPLYGNISYKTRHVHVNTMMEIFPFLSVAVLLFIFPPLKPFTSKQPNQIYVNKGNSCTA